MSSFGPTNVLIIIGNGFDLAHGLKSSFKDFVENYLNSAIEDFKENGAFKDALLELSFIKRGMNSHFLSQKPYLNIFEYLTLLESSEFVNVKFNSPILKNSLFKIGKLNWVDLEMEYFNVLSSKRRYLKGSAAQFTNYPSISEINEQLEYIREQFLSYLKKQMASYEHHHSKIMYDSLKKESLRFSSTLLLNFNYTDIAERYLDPPKELFSNNEIKTDIVYIHGDISKKHGDPVFGFGDEFDERYLSFEADNDNNLFRHIKSFEYFKNDNYSSLLDFIEKRSFIVRIFGHSCGLSDRTLLNYIFEHENCESIEVLYYETSEKNDYTEKTYEISRHFKDKVAFRRKIIPFTRSVAMPQPYQDKH